MSDVFDRNIVLVVFFIVYLYMQFLSIQSNSRSGWNNLTCNPLNLFTNSLFQSKEEANKEFEKCIVNLSAATTTELFRKEVDTQGNILANMSGIQTNYDKLSKTIEDYSVDISNTRVQLKTQVDEIKDTQDVVTEQSETTNGYINQYMTKLQSIFNNITSYFQK
jgi:ABC-type transporter Mla subunit MlaD